MLMCMVNKLEQKIIFTLLHSPSSFDGLKVITESRMGELKAALEMVIRKRIVLRSLEDRKVQYKLNSVLSEEQIIALCSNLDQLETDRIADLSRPVVDLKGIVSDKELKKELQEGGL